MPAANQASVLRHFTSARLTKPLPIYSHATIHQGTVHISCIQGFIPGTHEFPSPAASDQARQVFANLKTILEEVGSSLSLVIKLTIFMTDMHDFPKINEALDEAFPVDPPARSSIGVASLPADAKVVVEAIAAVREG
jgi:2-iminobutanoate/2-iminopropanoate deaminase